MKHRLGDARCTPALLAMVSPGCRALRLAFKMASEDLRLFFDCRYGRRWRIGVSSAYVTEPRASGGRLANGYKTLGR